MAVVLFTGVPKAGKTLFAVTKLLAILKADPKRPIFSDIKGLNIQGVESPPDDWSGCPDGSLIIYDEVQYRHPYRRSRGATKYQFILDLTTHAHRGIDVWLITQSPKFLHSDVTEVVGEHYHLTRPNNVKFSKYMRWNACENSPNGITARRECDAKGLVRHNPEVFAMYNSVQVDDDIAHHKKLDLPMGTKIQIVIFAICALYLLYRVYGYMSPDDADTRPLTVAPIAAEVVNDTDTPSDDSLPSDVIDNKEVIDSAADTLPAAHNYLPPHILELSQSDDTLPTSVVANDDFCWALNKYGERLTISDSLCRLMSNDTTMMPKSRRQSPSSAAAPVAPVANPPQSAPQTAPSVATAIAPQLLPSLAPNPI